MTIYIDESIREGSDGFVYVVAAVRPAGAGTGRDGLRQLLLPGQRYIHWRDESDERRTELVKAFNLMEVDVTIAVADPVPNRHQEAARAACLLVLADEMKLSNADWHIEGRGRVLNQRDSYTVLNAHRAGTIAHLPHVKFVSKSASPALWVADAAASIASEHFAASGRSDHWWRSLRFTRLVIRHTSA